MSNIGLNQYDENGLRHGEWIFHYGKMYQRKNYFHGILHGLDEGCYEDGTSYNKGYYNMGKEIGYWRYINKKYYFLCLI